MFDTAARLRNGPLQPLDGLSSLQRVGLVAEAEHLDAAIVRHHLLETEMGQRSELQQFVDRQFEANFFAPGRCHLQLADVIALAPAGGADGVAKDPEPGLISIDVFLVVGRARECLDGFDGPGDVIGEAGRPARNANGRRG